MKNYKVKRYAVKYLDEYENVVGNGYIETLTDKEYKPGDRVYDWRGQEMIIDFEI